MDKETLSNYGWIVVCVMVLAVLLALASPFGTFVAGAIKSTTAGLFNVNQAALGSAGIDVNDMVFENCDHLETEVRNVTDTYTGDTCCMACGAVMSTGQTVRAKVPEGATYTAADGTVYNPGDEFPETVNTGDVYTYGDYRYCYNGYDDLGPGNSAINPWSIDESQNGWGVCVVRSSCNKTTMGPILETINGKPIVNMCSTFSGCKNLTQAPIIPSTVTNLRAAFETCTSLTEEGLPIIPNSVTNMSETFQACTALTDLSDFVIPSSVTRLYNTFVRCTSLIAAPVIPSGVTDMRGTFQQCKALTGTITINTNNITNTDYVPVGSCANCFRLVDMTNITLTGSASKDVLNLIGRTGSNWTPIS